MTDKQEKPNIPAQIFVPPALQGVLYFKPDLSPSTKENQILVLGAGQHNGWGTFDRDYHNPTAQFSLLTTSRKQSNVDEKAMTQSGFIFLDGSFQSEETNPCALFIN